MPTADIAGIGGVQNQQSFSGGEIHTTIALPATREIWDGTRPIVVTGLDLYGNGYGGSRTVKFFVANPDGGARSESGWFGVPGGSLANSLHEAGLAWGHAHSPGNLHARVGVTVQSGLYRYGWNGAAGGIVYQGGSVLQNNAVLAGRIDYIQAPTAARFVSAVPLSPVAARVAWQWPADDGGTPITGYIIQWSKNNFASIHGSITVNGNTFQADIYGLAPGNWQFRLHATNYVTAIVGKASVLSNVASVTLVMPPGDPGDLDGWERFGAMPAGAQDQTTAGLRRVPVTFGLYDDLVKDTISKENFAVTGSPTLAADTHGGKRTVAGLTPGKVYRLRANGAYVGDQSGPTVYQIGVLGEGWSDPVDFAPAGTIRSFWPFEFVADSSSVDIAFRLAQSVQRAGYAQLEKFAIFDVALEEMPSFSPYRLQNTVYESSLLNHFDLANNSVGARWWVDAHGVTQFAADLGEGAVVATFTDTRTEGQLEYIDIDTSLDTRDIVNDLDVTNVGVELQEDGWASSDTTQNFQNLTSIATYGPRRQTLDVNLYDEDDYAGSVELRAAAIVGDDATLQRKVRRIRWNAQENAAVAGKLEVFSPVNVWRRGIMYPCRVVAISHDLSPKRWIMTLDLMER